MLEQQFHGIPLSDFLKLNKLEPGMKITLDLKTERRVLIVGNCTPFMQPSNSDGEVGWDWDFWKDINVISVKYDNDSVNCIAPNDIERAEEALRCLKNSSGGKK